MQIVREDILHELSNSIFSEKNKTKKIKMSSAEI